MSRAIHGSATTALVVVARAAGIFTLTALAPACEGDEPGADAVAELAPPEGLQRVVRVDGEVLVWSRSDDDVEGRRRVHHYEVSVDGEAPVPVTTNFAPLPESWEWVSVVPVDAEGRRGQAAEGVAPELPLSIASDGFRHGPTGAVPSMVYSPVYGPLEVLTGGTNVTQGPWGFWRHESGFHRPGGGIQGSNDTKCWDINLNVAGAHSNMDVGHDVVPMGFGTVQMWAGDGPGGNGAGELLIDHGEWFSGYLHMQGIKPKAGDYVTPTTVLGVIGRVGADNDHLHACVYTGENKAGGLKSFDVGFIPNQVSISFADGTSTTVGQGQSKTLPATAKLTHHCSADGEPGCAGPMVKYLNDGVHYDQTWWSSSSPGIATVDGYGKVTGKQPGSCTIAVAYGGVRKSIEVSVK